MMTLRTQFPMRLNLTMFGDTDKWCSICGSFSTVRTFLESYNYKCIAVCSGVDGIGGNRCRDYAPDWMTHECALKYPDGRYHIDATELEAARERIIKYLEGIYHTNVARLMDNEERAVMVHVETRVAQLTAIIINLFTLAKFFMPDSPPAKMTVNEYGKIVVCSLVDEEDVCEIDLYGALPNSVTSVSYADPEIASFYERIGTLLQIRKHDEFNQLTKQCLLNIVKKRTTPVLWRASYDTTIAKLADESNNGEVESMVVDPQCQRINDLRCRIVRQWDSIAEVHNFNKTMSIHLNDLHALERTRDQLVCYLALNLEFRTQLARLSYITDSESDSASPSSVTTAEDEHEHAKRKRTRPDNDDDDDDDVSDSDDDVLPTGDGKGKGKGKGKSKPMAAPIVKKPRINEPDFSDNVYGIFDTTILEKLNIRATSIKSNKIFHTTNKNLRDQDIVHTRKLIYDCWERIKIPIHTHMIIPSVPSNGVHVFWLIFESQHTARTGRYALFLWITVRVRRGVVLAGDRHIKTIELPITLGGTLNVLTRVGGEDQQWNIHTQVSKSNKRFSTSDPKRHSIWISIGYIPHKLVSATKKQMVTSCKAAIKNALCQCEQNGALLTCTSSHMCTVPSDECTTELFITPKRALFDKQCYTPPLIYGTVEGNNFRMTSCPSMELLLLNMLPYQKKQKTYICDPLKVVILTALARLPECIQEVYYFHIEADDILVAQKLQVVKS